MSETTKAGKRNRLASETSPYLKQHATNPVDWYPWGDEALEKARELDRPIFLSIGYSSCHWCHVMERESFENPEIARVMNEHFINIKVDREERPDLDAIYMTAVQMMTGSGGWPMSVFLTPDLKPFWGGTYFPPDSRYGRPGFLQVCTQIANAYETQRERLEEAAAELTEYIRRESERKAGESLPGKEVIQAAVEHSEQTFDAHHGGFGSAPKFPRPVELAQLLRYHHRTGSEHALLMCEKTLEAMAMGGMYDQIGGGFHRYSTDHRWLVPHFEKMLYDNALLAHVYLEAWQVTGRSLYRDVARETLDYVLRDMTSPEGGFYSATDADSEGVEGKYFVWTPGQVEEVVGAADARVLCAWYGITEGGNFEHGTSIAHRPEAPETVARALGLEVAEVQEIVERGRRALHEARNEREKPFRDEKVLTAWNGLMISAFARGGQVLGESRYVSAARKAAELLLEKAYVDGKLHRSYAEGQVTIPGYLDDYAFLTAALLDLYETTFELEYLERAGELMGRTLEHFQDSRAGGFFYTAPHHDSLLCRSRDDIDNSTPSGNAVAILNLLRLERMTGRSEHRDRAEAALQSVSAPLAKIPMAFGCTLLALDWLLYPVHEIALVGDLSGDGGGKLLRVVREVYLPGRILAASPDPVPAELSRKVPLLEGKKALQGKPTAYVCRNYACREPVTSAEELKTLLTEGQ